MVAKRHNLHHQVRGRPSSHSSYCKGINLAKVKVNAPLYTERLLLLISYFTG